MMKNRATESEKKATRTLKHTGDTWNTLQLLADLKVRALLAKYLRNERKEGTRIAVPLI